MSLPPEIPEPADRPETQPATADQLRQVENEKTSFERSTFRWAKIAVVMSGLAALFVCLQWYEMHTTSVDTRSLAIAAGNQANAAVVQTFLTKAQVEKMGETLLKTDDLITQATKQVKAVNRIAQQAAKSADTAERTLELMEVQQRAWVALKIPPRVQMSQGSVTWAVQNFGKSPASRVEATVEFVDELTQVGAAQDRACSAVETAHTGETRRYWELLFPGQSGNQRKAFLRGREIIYFVGCIKYADPFNDNRWTKFCYQPSTREPGNLVSCFAFNSTEADEEDKPQRPN